MHLKHVTVKSHNYPKKKPVTSLEVGSRLIAAVTSLEACSILTVQKIIVPVTSVTIRVTNSSNHFFFCQECPVSGTSRGGEVMNLPQVLPTE